MLLNEEQIDDYRKIPLLDGLHEAARIGQTRKWQWPSAWLARPKEALIHLAPNGWHGTLKARIRFFIDPVLSFDSFTEMFLGARML